MPLQSRIYATGNAAHANAQCSQNSGHALNEYKCIDTNLFTSACLRLDLCLLEYPIYSIRADCMQALNTGDRDQRSIRVVVLNNHFRAITAFSVCGSLPTHVSAASAYRGQLIGNPRASVAHRLQTHDRRYGNSAPSAPDQARAPHLAECSTNVPWAHYGMH